MRTEKPLLGFGPMGWALLAIAGAMALFYTLQDNPDLVVLDLIGRVFGSNIEEWVQTRLFSAHFLNAIPWIGPTPIFGLWSLCVVLFAFQIHPGPIMWWWRAAMILLAFSAPLFGLRVVPLWLSQGGFPIRIDTAWAFPLSYGCAHLLLVAIALGATRSIRVTFGIVFLSIASMASVYTVSSNSPFLLYVGTASNGRIWFVIAAWAWNPLLLAILLSWAIPARIRYNRKPWRCHQCRYDMRNLKTNTCPECGGVNERMPVNATTATASE